MTHTEWQRIGIIREQGAVWTRQQNFWLFGTCTYVDGTAVTRTQCVRNAQRFFNNLDRCVLGRRLYREIPDCHAWYTRKLVDFVLTHTSTSTSVAMPGNTTG